MPNSIFFLGGYAIHGTNAVGKLGRPVSHGCVRLAPGNAAKLFSMVKKYGSGNTRIVVTR
jgi:lipoprotein-anchoring transpeptidase ErfK/SrfK